MSYSRKAQDNYNYVLGRHQLKAGVNWTYQRSPNIFLPKRARSEPGGPAQLDSQLSSRSVNELQLGSDTITGRYLYYG